MCPLWPLHYVILYILFIVPLLLVFAPTVSSRQSASTRLKVNFSPVSVKKLEEAATVLVNFSTTEVANLKDNNYYEIQSSDDGVAKVTSGQIVYLNATPIDAKSEWSFNLTGVFMGYAKVKVKLKTTSSEVIGESDDLPVSVVRKYHVLDKIFVYSIIGLVSFAYINMGCTMDLDVVKKVMRRPCAPLIGLISQYIGMPLISFGIARLFLPLPSLQLGMFATGCSPGGGASNIWTLVLNGNLNLSLAMTFVSSIAAFGLMPAWLFSLGRVIFTEGDIVVPYRNIASLIIGLVVPLGIGLAIQRWLPRLAGFMRRILRPLSVCLIIYIVVFGTVSNLYIFKIFTWQMILAGFLLPFLGFAIGATLSRIARFPLEDIIAIAVETGVQNTGVSIFILRLSLEQPDADLTTAVPVAVAIMTPIPLCILWIIRKVWTPKKDINDNPKGEPIHTIESYDDIINNAKRPEDSLLDDKAIAIATQTSDQGLYI